jgi:hypothetical protein
MTAPRNNRRVPTFEILEAREVASANPVTRPAALLDQAHVESFRTGPKVVYGADVRQGQALAPGAAGAMPGASFADPLRDFHRVYVGLNDLRKGDILLVNRDVLVSNVIKFFSNSNYNHAALYVGDGKVVEAVDKGVQHIAMTDFLAHEDNIVRVMVLRNGNLSNEQRDNIAAFAISKVGKLYNLEGVLAAGTGYRGTQAGAFHRDNYYCSQLVTAAYSYAGARLDPDTLDLSPGHLAARVKDMLTAVGAVYDKVDHRAVREGRDCVNLDLTDRERDFVADSFSKKFGNTHIAVQRLTLDSNGNFRGHLKVIFNNSVWMDITFENRDIRIDSTVKGYEYSVDQWLQGLRSELSKKYFGPRTAAVDEVFASMTLSGHSASGAWMV